MFPSPREPRRLSWPEWALCLDAALLLPMTPTVLWLRGIQRTTAILDRWPLLCARCSQTLEPQRVCALVAVVASLYGTRCLPLAIVSQAILRHLDVESELVIGAAGFGSCFRAHAWVELEGIVVPGQSAEGFQPIHRLAAPATRSRGR